MHYGTSAIDLIASWRGDAATLRDFGAVAQAATLEKCADDLEQLLEEAARAPLTLQEAADLGGYSTDHLGRLVRDGKIPNAGRPGAPRIAREDVPIKSGQVAEKAQIRDFNRTQIVRSAISEGV